MDAFNDSKGERQTLERRTIGDNMCHQKENLHFMSSENDKNATLREICVYVVQEIDWSSFCELRINS